MKITEQNTSCPEVRVTGLLVENNELLIVKQLLKERSNWNLPGGALEFGETLEQALIREMKEETGLVVEVGELLYVCDRFRGLKKHVVDMSFSVRRVDGSLRSESMGNDGEEDIASIRMAPIDELVSFGFSKKFTCLISDRFPQRGSYQGEFHSFYG